MTQPLSKEKIVQADAEIERLVRRVETERQATKAVAAELAHTVTTQTRLLKITRGRENDDGKSNAVDHR